MPNSLMVETCFRCLLASPDTGSSFGQRQWKHSQIHTQTSTGIDILYV